VDEIHLHVMPVLVGGGTRFFGDLDAAIELERVDARITSAATHLKYRVVR